MTNAHIIADKCPWSGTLISNAVEVVNDPANTEATLPHFFSLVRNFRVRLQHLNPAKPEPDSSPSLPFQELHK
jgi:hypothetical protein